MTWQDDLIRLRVAREEVKRLTKENRDLRRHLKDRDTHIALLEAQLMPQLRNSYGTGGNQEAIL